MMLFIDGENDAPKASIKENDHDFSCKQDF
jgi:hypothetical protein